MFIDQRRGLVAVTLLDGIDEILPVGSAELLGGGRGRKQCESSDRNNELQRLHGLSLEIPRLIGVD